MRKIFYPESIAVIGVSESHDNFGRNIVKNLLDFQYQGRIYPVGNKGGSVFGLKIYKSVEDISGAVGLAVMLIPSRAVPEQFEACARKGIKRVCISSGGFSEFGGERKELEQRLIDVARENDIRFIGPNCLAIINQDHGVCLPFVRMSRFPVGNVSLMTQSGGVGLSFIYMFAAQNLGINKYVSLGNKLNIGEQDLIPFLESDDCTGVIGMYLEEIDKGREFMEAVRGCRKPIVVLKSNTTATGARVAASHTAAIANDDRVVDAALKQVGVARIENMHDMTAACKIFKMPPMKGNRVAILTPTGGYAVILADMCEKYGFEIPPFSKDFVDDVSKHVRAGVIRLTNPLDLGDMFDLQMVAHTVVRAMQEPQFDALILSWIFMRDTGLTSDSVNIFPILDSMLKRIPKPIALSLVGSPSDISQIQKTTDFPIFSSPEGSLRALSILRNHHSSAGELRAQIPIIKEDIDKESIERALDAAGEGGQLGVEALDVLQACGIPTVPVKLAATAEEAVVAASEMGYPVAMKIASKDILHKTDSGGVKLNISSDKECRAAFEEMMKSAAEKVPGAALSGVHVQKMAAQGREMIVGATLNESFGHVVTFGVGGVAVEALGDISIRVAPIGPLDASALLDEIKASRMLGAFRGMPPADRDALKDVLYRVSTLVTKFPRIKELDINPLIAYEEGKGCAAVDARIILR